MLGRRPRIPRRWSMSDQAQAFPTRPCGWCSVAPPLAATVLVGSDCAAAEPSAFNAVTLTR